MMRNSFSTLGVVAGIVNVIGWIVAAVGIILVILAFKNSGGYRYSGYETTAVSVGFSVIVSGLFCILGGGAVKVLIAIYESIWFIEDRRERERK